MPMGRLLLFWDYDTQWGFDADRARGLNPRAEAGPREFECTERLLALHARLGIPACFAVVGAAGEDGARPYHDPDQVRRLHSAGHEVASHGYRHEWVPGMDGHALREMLLKSRTALESCIAHPVTTFVPPYNQPFDHPAGWSISLQERRAVPSGRTSLRGLCRALKETGYHFCRIADRSLWRRAADRIAGHPMNRPSRLVSIAGIRCARLNTPCGFGPHTLEVVSDAGRRGGLVVAYGHPHSLEADNDQREDLLVPFLERVARLRDAGRLRPMLPRECGREVIAA